MGITPLAHAAFIVNIVESGGNVVVSGTGSLDITGLAAQCNPCGNIINSLYPSIALVTMGNPSGLGSVYNTVITGPVFGLGAETDTPIGTGSDVGIAAKLGQLYVPASYVSGSLVTSTSTYNSTTLAALGAVNGTYTYTWGSGVHADSLVINVATPESSSAPLTLAGLGGIALLMWKRRRAAPSAG